MVFNIIIILKLNYHMQPIQALMSIAAAWLICSTVIQCSTEHDVTLLSLNCRNPHDISPNNIKKIESITGWIVFQICEMKWNE